ncbi:transferrin-binding protein-like solute binding protein [Neisseria cinerea]|uniref:transferrin-binding protein-like solute binding protein n=1 Tax=Neisseria cinerea TaxID=483 RepID=UPI00131B73B5|nr:transferrin-binding protein-like solute binding protein [Neisseria cinerea]
MSTSFKLSVLTVACTLALSACNSSGGGSPSVQPTPTPNPTQPATPEKPKASAAYDTAKAAYDALWGGDDSLKTGFEEKITNSALNKRLVEAGRLNYQDEANKAKGNVYASEADKAAAQKEAGDWKETADKYVAALTAAREKAEATKAAAEKAVAEADKMLAEKPEDATAKAYKEKAQALVKSAESALERFPVEDLATGKAAQAEAEKAVAAANAATVKAEEKPVEDKPAEDKPKEEKPTTPAEEPKQPETPAEKGFGGDGKVMTKVVDGGIVVAKKRDTGDQDYGSVEAPKAETKDAVLLEGVSINTKEVKEGAFVTDEHSKNGKGENPAQRSLHSGNLLSDVRYGGVADFTNAHLQNDVKQAVFVQGNPSSQDVVAAKEGTATYEGYGLHFKNGKPFGVDTDSLGYALEAAKSNNQDENGKKKDISEVKLQNTYLDAKATKVIAKVNFGKKTVNVGINRFFDTFETPNGEDPRLGGKDGVLKASARDMENLTFDGKLSGNTFADDAGNLQGGFYGATGDQLAGMYKKQAKNNRDEEVETRGVFGAKRTDGKNTEAGVAKPEQPTEKPKVEASAQTDQGAFGERFITSTNSELTKLIVNGTEIALTPGSAVYGSKGLVSDKNLFVASNNLSNVVFGAARLADGQNALFVQGVLSQSLPQGTAEYVGDVLNFRARNIPEKLDWLDPGSSFRTNGSFIANVNFGAKTVTGTIKSGDRWYMRDQNFTGTLSGSNFNATWDNKAQGSLSGGFYGANAAEMAGRYSYNMTPDKNDSSSNNAFGVFGGKKK